MDAGRSPRPPCEITPHSPISLSPQHEHDDDPDIAAAQHLLDAINRRPDELDRAARPAVAGILTAAERPPPADRIYVKRRLQFIGAPTPTPTGPPHSVTGDHLTSRTLRRLSRSPFAPIPPEVPVLRTDLLCRLVIERLASIGPLPEGECSTRSTGEHQAEGPRS